MNTAKLEEITVTIDQLKNAIDILLDECKNRRIDNLSITHRPYRSIDPSDSFSMVAGDPSFLIGDIYEDVLAITKIKRRHLGMSSVDLARLAAIFSFLAVKFKTD